MFYTETHGERNEKRFRKSQVNVARLAMAFKVSYPFNFEQACTALSFYQEKKMVPTFEMLPTLI